MRFLFLLFSLCCVCAANASAQIEPTNQRAANRKALRDARKHPAPYKGSHLAVNKESLKQGAGGRTPATEAEASAYRFDKTGAARVSEPSTVSLRLRKKKKEAPTTD